MLYILTNLLYRFKHFPCIQEEMPFINTKRNTLQVANLPLN